MKIKLISLLACIVAILIVALPTLAKEEKKPLKVIAPDLIVESFDFGVFPDGPKEVPSSKVKFKPTKTISGGFVGYRLKLNTDRKEIKWAHQSDTLNCRSKEISYPVENGLIYMKWVITAGYPKGKHWIRGWIEGVELPRLNYTVK